MGPSRLFTVLSIFKYFYPIAERADRIARELDAGAKRETWLGRVWVGTVKNKATFCKDVYNLSILRLAHFIRLPAPTPACVTLASVDFSFACQWKLERLWIVYGQASSVDPGNHWHVRTSGQNQEIYLKPRELLFVNFRSGHPKVVVNTSHQQIWFSNRRKAGVLEKKQKQF